MELLASLAVVKKVLDVVRYLVGGEQVQLRETGIVALSFGLGIALAFLVAASSFAAEVGLADAGWADVVLAGVMAGASAGVVTDFTKGGVDIL